MEQQQPTGNTQRDIQALFDRLNSLQKHDHSAAGYNKVGADGIKEIGCGCRAILTSDQSIAHDTVTAVSWDDVDFEDVDDVVLDRVNPTRIKVKKYGRYEIHFHGFMDFSNSDGMSFVARLYKNGVSTDIRVYEQLSHTSGNTRLRRWTAHILCTLVLKKNDYIEVKVTQINNGSTSENLDEKATYLEIVRVK